MQRKALINISKLKEFAYKRLPRSWLLRDLIISEKELLCMDEFLAKIEVWLKIARYDLQKNSVWTIHDKQL